MRELSEGWETDVGPVNGWTATSAFGSRNTTTRNLDTQGNGGVASWQMGSGDHFTPSFRSQVQLKEFWVRAYFRVPSGNNNNFSITPVADGNADRYSGVFIDYPVASIQILRLGTGGTIQGTSGITLSTETWYRLEVHFRLDDIDGFVKVYLDDDGSYSAPVVEYNGDTNSENNANSTCEALELAGSGHLVDDFAINSMTILYRTGTGTPVAGNTLTTPAGTFQIESVETFNATTGRLMLSGVGDWGDTVFTDADAISSTGFTGVVDAPTTAFVNGFEPGSGPAGPGFIVYLIPNANGTFSQLTGTDGNSVDNYLLVDDVPPDATTEGVVGDTDLLTDTYGLDDTSLPVSALNINLIEVPVYAFRDGTVINYAPGVVRTGGTVYEPNQLAQVVSASASQVSHLFAVDPSDNDVWDVATVRTIEAGVRVKATA